MRGANLGNLCHPNHCNVTTTFMFHRRSSWDGQYNADCNSHSAKFAFRYSIGESITRFWKDCCVYEIQIDVSLKRRAFKMRKCEFHYSAVAKNVWIFVAIGKGLRSWKHSRFATVLGDQPHDLDLYERVDREKIDFAFCYRFRGIDQAFLVKGLLCVGSCSSHPAVESIYLIAYQFFNFLTTSQPASKEASKQRRPCPYARDAIMCSNDMYNFKCTAIPADMT